MKISLALFVLFFGLWISPSFGQSTASPDTVCAGGETYYQIASPTLGSSFSWGIDGSGGTLRTTAKADSVRVQWSGTPGLALLWVVETNSAGCPGDTVRLPVRRVAPPTAAFDNALLCHGEELGVVFTGEAPYSLVFSLDGVSTRIDGITQNPYPLASPGLYQLLGVNNKHCAGQTLSGASSATIAPPLPILQILHD